MNKERLAAFMDAVLAIIMTILILELKKPETATLKALWNLRVDFFAYTLSFFWLGTMWVNLHNEWHKIKYITPSIVWVNVVLLFFSSFFPYVTSFVTSYYNSSVAQGFYGIIVLAVTFCNIISGHLIGKANRNDEKSQESLKIRMRWLSIDIIIKIMGLIISCTFYPPAMMISVYITLLGIVLPAQYKATKRRREK
ncbi:TMEM175 family protein [Leptotrichia hongkongensis]|uniref:TMEM175 family protein n=1 Tax=Leptotrichia hongkongensis TaxID=554406 RepID=UPI0035A97C71